MITVINIARPKGDPGDTRKHAAPNLSEYKARGRNLWRLQSLNFLVMEDNLPISSPIFACKCTSAWLRWAGFQA